MDRPRFLPLLALLAALLTTSSLNAQFGVTRVYLPLLAQVPGSTPPPSPEPTASPAPTTAPVPTTPPADGTIVLEGAGSRETTPVSLPAAVYTVQMSYVGSDSWSVDLWRYTGVDFQWAKVLEGYYGQTGTVDFFYGQSQLTKFKVTANGAWKLTIRPLAEQPWTTFPRWSGTGNTISTWVRVPSDISAC